MVKNINNTFTISKTTKIRNILQKERKLHVYTVM